MDPQQLMELLRLHTEEVRFQVQLNWDRAKGSLAFHAALLGLVAGLDVRVLPRSFTLALFAFVAVSALFCAAAVQIGHGYYRAARERRELVEKAVGPPVTFGSTRSQRHEAQPGFERLWPKVNSILVLLHFLLFGVALAGLLIYWP